MKVIKLKTRYRVETPLPIGARNVVYNFCKKLFGRESHWVSRDALRWHVPWYRKKLYVYFKHEEDVVMFLLKFNMSNNNG